MLRRMLSGILFLTLLSLLRDTFQYRTVHTHTCTHTDRQTQKREMLMTGCIRFSMR